MYDKLYYKKGIIIEGVECAGKTTLIQKLRNEVMPWDCKMLSHKSCQQFDRFITEYVIGDEVIFNRSHISEVVYSKLWNRNMPFSFEERKVLDEYIKRHYILVLCEAETSLLVERYNSRDFKQKVTTSELDGIKQNFNSECYNMDFVYYNSSRKESLDNIIPVIQAALCVQQNVHHSCL